VILTLVRHATLLLDYGGRRLLVDPMLGDPGSAPPIEDTPNQRPNPLVPLPVPAGELMTDLDGLLVTHLHADHLDAAAEKMLPKALPLACQPEDVRDLRDRGFEDVRPVDASIDFLGIDVARTGGQHGTGEIALELGPVSGFVLRADGEPALYIAGDTIWCEDVRSAITVHSPDVTVVNAGGARFNFGDPITMTPADVITTAEATPGKVIAVHMEAINHCVDTRSDLSAAASGNERILIPDDGEALALS
jgi:L-ascorbate metabolism protein UlaG (beta-lactamase superfamily)